MNRYKTEKIGLQHGKFCMYRPYHLITRIALFNFEFNDSLVVRIVPYPTAVQNTATFNTYS